MLWQELPPVEKRPRRLPVVGPKQVAALHELEGMLQRSIEGEVRFDDGARALYATDGSNFRQVPIGVVLPRSKADVLATVAACRAVGAPVLSRGGGTSLAGQCCNVAVVLDFSKYLNRVLDVNPNARRAVVEPGCILDDLRHDAQRFGVTFGPDPATHNHCTLGGMLGNNSCGVHSMLCGKFGWNGRTSDNTESLEVLTYDGTLLRVGATSDREYERILREGGRPAEIYRALRQLRDKYASLIRARFPKIPRRVSGYNLDDLLPENGFQVARALVGTESTCVTILEAELRLVEHRPYHALAVIGFDDVYAAADAVTTVGEFAPTALEGIDDELVELMKEHHLHRGADALMPAGKGWLFVQFGGDTQADAMARAYEVLAALGIRRDAPRVKVYPDGKDAERLWQVRESGLGATARMNGTEAWPGWEDSAVAPARVGPYLRELRRLFDEHGLKAALYGHFGQGCVHCRVTFDLKTHDGIVRYRKFLEAAADLVASFGGSASGEHGDGQQRGELLARIFGPELVGAFREFKAIWDPDGRMNPGKVVDPYRLDDNLRLGSHYEPHPGPTHFAFTDDEHDFARATRRCVGVGKCRRMETDDAHDAGTMCPSFLVTREEEHSTRGRARLLFEMLEGNPLDEGWRSDAVKESLDLCLACKGCKGDCPVAVDMATYKAEFLAHYYEGRVRPPAAYAMGLIWWWARVAQHVPELVNLVGRTPGLASLVKRLGGIAPERTLPRFAPETFTHWFKGTARDVRPDGRTVILWPDTFTNFFRPNTGRSAALVLEAAGFRVLLPPGPLCCGRPLYDFGFLDLAKRLLQRNIATLRPYLEAGVPIVGLEPSCIAVFKDELGQLLPRDEDAHRLARQSWLLGDFLVENAPDFTPPRLDGRRALLHGHCHQKALKQKLGMDNDTKILVDKLGLDVDAPKTGCCGMAGSFGFEADKYEVSQKIGERVVLPTVRAADPASIVVANGFSCREQIEQGTDRRALHLADVLAMALRRNAAPQYPERRYPDHLPTSTSVKLRRIATAIAGAAALGAIAAVVLRRR